MKDSNNYLRNSQNSSRSVMMNQGSAVGGSKSTKNSFTTKRGNSVDNFGKKSDLTMTDEPEAGVSGLITQVAKNSNRRPVTSGMNQINSYSMNSQRLNNHK
jgi:hypothetical protein